MFNTQQQQPASRHTAVWEDAAASRNRWLEALVTGVIAVYFAGGLLGTIGLF